MYPLMTEPDPEAAVSSVPAKTQERSFFCDINHFGVADVKHLLLGQPKGEDAQQYDFVSVLISCIPLTFQMYLQRFMLMLLCRKPGGRRFFWAQDQCSRLPQ